VTKRLLDASRVRERRATTRVRRLDGNDASSGGVFSFDGGRVVVVVGGGGGGDAEGNGADVVFEQQLAPRMDYDDDAERRIPMRGAARVVDKRVDERRGESDDDADVAGADGRLERGARGEGLEQV